MYAVSEHQPLQPPPSPTPLSSERQRIAQAFRELRAERGLTQEQLAHRAGLTLSGYRPYESGRRYLRGDQLARFAEAFGVSTDALRQKLGYGAGSLREVQLATCQEILAELEGMTPQQSKTILEWLRYSLRVHKRVFYEPSN